MRINETKSFLLSMMIALPFLGGVDECRGPDPEPDPDPELCLVDDECAADAWCNTDRCLSPAPAPGEMASLTVCYGTCEPRPVCAPVTCELYCEDGFAIDASGCEVCACADPPPPPMCEPILCTLYCEGGFATDERGCPTCACEPPVECAPVLCDLYCEGGLAQDENGCEICTCEEPPPPACEPVLCDLYCEHGFTTDERGCDICACEEPPPPACEPVLCDLYCEYGFTTDERGCDVCACNPPPTDRNCGGFIGLTCAAGEFCDYASDVPACGAADHLGTCRARPDACYEIYAPVCGCDGVTYPNDCYANAAGTDVAATGECFTTPPSR